MVRQKNTKSGRNKKAKTSKKKEESLVFNCTSCAQPQLLVQGKRNILCHPFLQVGVCRECLIFSHSDLVPKDNDGYDIYCMWCSELGNLTCCDECRAPICQECITRNVSADYFDSLGDQDIWKCFACEPSPIEEVRAITKAALDFQNFGDPSDLLFEMCTAVFQGDADLNDSDRDDFVKERIRLRRENYKRGVSNMEKEKKDEMESGSAESVVEEKESSSESEKKKKKKLTLKRKPKKEEKEELESEEEKPKKKLKLTLKKKYKEEMGESADEKPKKKPGRPKLQKKLEEISDDSRSSGDEKKNSKKRVKEGEEERLGDDSADEKENSKKRVKEDEEKRSGDDSADELLAQKVDLGESELESDVPVSEGKDGSLSDSESAEMKINSDSSDFEIPEPDSGKKKKKLKKR